MVSSVKVLNVPSSDQAGITGLSGEDIGSQIFNTDTGMMNFTPDGVTFQNLVNSGLHTLVGDINFDLSFQGFTFLTDNASDYVINLTTGDNVPVGGVFYVNCNSGTTVTVQADGGVSIDGAFGASYKMSNAYQYNRFTKVATDAYQSGGALYFPGTNMTMVANGDNTYTLNATTQATQYPIGYVSGLTCNYTTDTTVTLEPGSCRNSTNSSNITLGASVVVNISLSGAVNRLDTGAVANNTWYYLYVISNANGSLVGGLFSLSATSPTLPSGYTIFRRVGAVRYSTKILRFKASGVGQNKTYYYTGDTGETRVLLAGGAIVQTPISCSSFIPPTASDDFLASIRLTPVVASFAYFEDTGNTVNITATNYRVLASVAGAQLIDNFPVVANSSKSIDYILSESGAVVSVIVVSFIDNI